jgi:hypothetical protein
LRNSVVPELAAIADGFPELDLADLAAAHEHLLVGVDVSRRLTLTDARRSNRPVLPPVRVIKPGGR